MRRTLALVALFLVCLSAAACSDDAATGTPPPAGTGGSGGDGACVTDGDCNGDQICIDSVCVAPDGDVCSQDSHCDLGEHCTAGRCEAGTACSSNADCRRGDSCQDGGCQPDPRQPCVDASECRAGTVCVDRFCEAGGADGGEEADCLSYAPPAVEDPGDETSLRGVLQFGSSPNIGDVRVVEVTVTNTCERGVTVLQAARESATSAEFAVATDRPLPVTLADREQLVVTVTYAPVDFQEDRTGQFVDIVSDDVHPTAKYELQVEYKGSSVLALTEDAADEEPSVVAWNFGAISVGQTATKTLFLKNTGNGNHLLHVAAISTTSGTPFTVTPAFDRSGEPLVLPPFRGCVVDADCAPGQGCDAASGGICAREDGSFADVVPVVVTFTPVAARPESATLTLVHDAGGVDAATDQSYTVVLVGGGGNPPALALNPPSFDFGEVEINTFATRTLRIENAGDQLLSVSNLRLASLSSAEFTFSPLAIPDIPAGAFQTLDVQYAPVGPAIGTDVGALEFDTNDPAAPVGSVSLTGTSTNPTAFVSPTTLDLGQVWPGDPPATGRVTVRNAGFGNLQVTAVAVSAGSDPGFTLPNLPALPYDLPDGTVELQLEVAFAPATLGARTGVVEIRTTDADNPLVTVSLTGEALDCTCTLPGATFTCNRGVCVFAACLPGFIDLDGRGDTGCEYACTPTGAMFDPPDDLFADEDCDGVDGMLGGAIFVSGAGADSNPGTRQLPMRSLRAAVANAASQGKDVYVAGGVYTESSTLALADGVSIHGAYNATDWSRSDLNVTEVVGPTTAVSATNVSSETILDHLTITGAANLAPGGSAYGIHATSSSGLVVRRSIISAGRGGDGADGASVPGIATAGDPGSPGQVGCEGDDEDILCWLVGDQCTQPQGGPGGTNPFCSAAGGRGGNGNFSNSNGDPGSASPGGAAGGPGTPPFNGDWDTPSQYWGSDGLTGAAGTDGLPGIPTFLAAGYQPAGGTSGANGRDGRGGGGGGGGGGGQINCYSRGGGGGGGAAGGCGGRLATGGSSAGGSFAIYLWASSARIEACDLRTAGGGIGGDGGTGQTGGPGGLGGWGGDQTKPGAGNPYGGNSTQDDASNGGRGGRGGDGGRGGHGGGGAGGPSVGVLRGGGSAPTLSANTYTLGPGGRGGASSGNAGPDGAQQDVQLP